MRILGVDFGERRTGIAISDELLLTAQAVGTIHEREAFKTAERVAEIIKEKNAQKVVVGLPKNMDGSVGFRGEATLKFTEYLKELTSVPVIMWDERLTTVAAARTLDEVNVRGKKRKNVIDTVAATYILQGYLDSLFRGDYFGQHKRK